MSTPTDRELRAKKRAVVKPASTPRRKASTKKKSSAVSLADDEAASSDDFELSDTAASVQSNTSTGSRREKLPLNVEKQLLLDIEAKGGIQYFGYGKSQGIAALLDTRKELYGNRGDQIRDKLRKRIQYLRSLKPKKYSAHLVSLGVTRQTTQRAYVDEESEEVSDLDDFPVTPSKNSLPPWSPPATMKPAGGSVGGKSTRKTTVPSTISAPSTAMSVTKTCKFALY
jgi:hypothetical protein